MKPMTQQQDLLLDITDLSAGYGKAVVVNNVSMQVRRGEFVALLGRNGAGKSTILKALSGLIPKRGGTIGFAGQDITNASPRDIVRSGVVHVLEGHRVFTTLTVEDNLLIGTYAGGRDELSSRLEEVYSIFPELANRKGQYASRLSGGQQQILAVAQGIISRPKMLILDEPSGGLAPLLIDRILDVASSLCKRGLAILLVEQLVEKSLARADTAYLLETGRIVLQGSSAELTQSDAVLQHYLGGQVSSNAGVPAKVG